MGADAGHTATLPEPLTPAVCDLRGYAFMPLHGQRLYGSQLYSLALRNPRAGIAAQKLWWEAWTQCPAASLPDDDFDLARLADFGSDLKGWRAVKEIALRGFVKCSDGRLYHGFLASEALRTYELRIRSDKKRESDRERLKSWRERRGNGQEASRPETQSTIETCMETPAETRSETPNDTRSETQYETRFVAGREKKRRESSLAADCTPPARDPEPPSATNGDRLDVEGVAIWSTLTGDNPRLAKIFVGDLAKSAPPGSEPKLMALLRQAEADPPHNSRETLSAWLSKRVMPPPPDCPALRNKLPIEKMPRLGDPPNRWADFADSGQWQVDDEGVSRPIFAGFLIDVVIRSLCAAAGITDPNYRGDFDVPLAWLRDGFDPGEHILPVIRAVIARGGKPISRLKYFDAAVREQRGVS